MTSANVFAQEELVPVVSLGALNKITAKLETINVGRNETVKFGTLEISMRACSSNPPEETPESVAFLEITDLGHVGEPTKIFSGWMFASSPAVSPLEHAVYDVWVTDCKMVDPSASSDKE
ncbi:MAG: DUF2155 domain-containing protein [Kordiimonadaceae bacterium]|nr:DUF2155 domain-containing protein [Kordiimonadaceae bacterium]MBT6037013.1 DUF2155 domain-containing protein [Kordiimonadaceae bacterium]